MERQIKYNGKSTPYYIYNENIFIDQLLNTKKLFKELPLKVLYSIKAASCGKLLNTACLNSNGLSTSSLFEAKFARENCPQKEIHCSSPGFIANEIPQLFKLTNFIYANSLSQLKLISKWFPKSRIGLRVNPEISFIDNSKYDPCRLDSKLGIPLSKIKDIDWGSFPHFSGMHFHANCESESLSELISHINHINQKWPWSSCSINWINLGGGYKYSNSKGQKELVQTLSDLVKTRNIDQIYIEPGYGLINSSGSLVTTVIDIISQKETEIIILDTAVNHMPEVLEFNFRPSISFPEPGLHSYILAGRSCLAGDIFGTYGFIKPLKIGDHIVFKDVGAYSAVKATDFNGIGIPDVYLISSNGEWQLMRRENYNDYKRRFDWTD